METKKILVADDEERIRRLVSDFLIKAGYQVLEAKDGEQAIDMITDNPDIDLAILDVMMPVYDGWAVCREIRRELNIPIIMLTARVQENDQLFGFELGADEYITKPFSPNVLVARVQALFRRSEGNSKGVSSFDGLELDRTRHTVKADGSMVDLSPKEFQLLMYFIDNEGIALSRDRILNAVWDYNYFGDARTVDTHVKKLRLKLGMKGDYIQTIRGMGYRFEVEL